MVRFLERPRPPELDGLGAIVSTCLALQVAPDMGWDRKNVGIFSCSTTSPLCLRLVRLSLAFCFRIVKKPPLLQEEARPRPKKEEGVRKAVLIAVRSSRGTIRNHIVTIVNDRSVMAEFRTNVWGARGTS